MPSLLGEARKRRNKMKILIIEDELGAAVALEHFLKPLASRIIVAKTMQQALQEMSGANEIDLITVDLGLPDSDPDNTIRKIKEIRAMRPDSLIVVVTGQDLPNLAAAVTDAGADGFLTKQSDDFSSKGFLQLLATIVQRYTTQAKPHQQSITLLERVATKLASLQTNENAVPSTC